MYLDENEVDDLVFGETDRRNLRIIVKGAKQTPRNRYSEENEEEDIDEALLEKLRNQLQRANQTIVNMRNKEKLLRTR